MAKGLVDEDTDIAAAVKSVLADMRIEKPSAVPGIPHGKALEQPDLRKETKINPWKKETLNYTEQGRIVKENRQEAERLAREAGVNLYGQPL